MRKTILFLFLAAAITKADAQTDSLEVKLTKYRDLYTKGLIDSQEYVMLKAKALGLDDDKPGVSMEDVERKRLKIGVFTLQYDTTKREKIFPAGEYMSIEELINKKPGEHCTVYPTLKRTYNYSTGLGGNVILKTKDDCISEKDLGTKVWLYSDGVRCFINLYTLKLQSHYNPVLTMGRYITFFKNQPNEVVTKLLKNAGPVEQEISQAVGNYYRQLYVIDMKSAMLYMVDEEYMNNALKGHNLLKEKFVTELGSLTTIDDARSRYIGDGSEDEKSFLFARYLQYLNDLQ